LKIILVGSDKLGFKYGGGQVYVKNLVTGLLAKQHDVLYLSIVFADISLPQRVWASNTNIKELQLIMPSNWREENNTADAPHITNEVAAVFKEFGPDIIHAHGLKANTSLGAERAGIPCVVTVHHGGIVCPAGALLNQRDEICTVPADQHTCLPCCMRNIPGSKLWLPLLRLIPLDVQLRLGRWLQARRFMYFITPLGTLALSIREKLAAIKTLCRNATCLIAPSYAIHDALIHNGIPANKVVVFPHGIPLLQRQPLRTDFGKGPMLFLFIGRISYVKGLHIMLEAFSGLPSNAYELHIVGGAITKPERRYLAKLQQRYAAVNSIWHGSQPHEEIPQYIASCDVMVHPVICLEVYGLTIAEALAIGRPVISTRCGGPEMQIRDGDNGLLVPPNDAKALRQAIESIINEPRSLQTMANQIGNVPSIEQHVNELEKIYIEAIGEVVKE
jgi:glycosyltransferase involved in cell wall biosynthesis